MTDKLSLLSDIKKQIFSLQFTNLSSLKYIILETIIQTGTKLPPNIVNLKVHKGTALSSQTGTGRKHQREILFYNNMYFNMRVFLIFCLSTTG